MSTNARDRRKAGNPLQLALATGAFAVCFAAFGSVAAMMPILKLRLGLTPMQVSVALAISVLLGSLGRIPLGALADRYGGRRVHAAVFAASGFAAALMGLATSFGLFVPFGFYLGIALASFSGGISFVNCWYPLRGGGKAHRGGWASSRSQPRPWLAFWFWSGVEKAATPCWRA